MYKSDILNLINNINKKQKEITEAKIIFNNLKVDKESKMNRNYNRFKERFEVLDNEEKRIKSLFDNKFFKFIKIFDFLNENEIIENKNFQINTEIGCLNMNPKTIIGVNYSDRIISLDKKSISYKFNLKKIINSMSYSFYSKETKLPLVPNKIIFKYDNHIDNFTESYFRYFNNNNTTDFISKFIFEPKQVKEIIFYFDEEVEINNSFVKFDSIQYQKDNQATFLIENNYKLNIFNIFKKSNELFKEFIFSYSKDNNKFENIDFINNEGIIKLKDKNNFILKIETNDKKIKQQEKAEIKNSTIDFKSLEKEHGVYKIPSNDISLESIKITFPISSSNIIKEKFSQLSISETEHFSAGGGILTLNQNHIKNISEIDKEKLGNLKLYDDEIILKTNSEALNFYFDKENNLIYTSSFLSKYNFYLTYQYKEKEEQIGDEYYTPMLFEFSLKG